jgi:hypothetical protein
MESTGIADSTHYGHVLPFYVVNAARRGRRKDYIRYWILECVVQRRSF